KRFASPTIMELTGSGTRTVVVKRGASCIIETRPSVAIRAALCGRGPFCPATIPVQRIIEITGITRCIRSFPGRSVFLGEQKRRGASVAFGDDQQSRTVL